MSAKPRVEGSVVAGFPSPAEQYQEPPLDLNELLVRRPAATFFVRVQGDSMTGEGIRDGDLLVVDRSLRPADGDVVIASVDGDFTVKTYRRDGSGVRLEPANPAYPVIRLRHGQELDYFGKVTACIHRFAGK
ncbi:MAG: translesion error-prone DNA polymerase V autoproteolytic subunit [Kiritimatiellae bacterium]|nr:translesion error-prone DNA polymerase V autoproteolytic subunit [Kiritimatiellia bacterium]